MLEKSEYSVIIATFNRASYLSDCLNSLAMQKTHASYEVVIIDDGSTDETLQVVHEYIKRHPKVFRLFEQEHRGLAAAKNLGIISSRGGAIVILDDDIIVPYDFLERIDSFLAECDFDVVGWIDLPRRDDHYLAKSIRHLENFSRKYLVRDLRNRLKGNLVIKRSVFAKVGNFDESRPYRMAEDTEFNYRLAQTRTKMTFSDELYVYHRSPNYLEWVKRSYLKLVSPKMLNVPEPTRYYRVRYGLFFFLILVAILTLWKQALLPFVSAASSVLFMLGFAVSQISAGTPIYGPGIMLVAVTRLIFVILYSLRFAAMRAKNLIKNELVTAKNKVK
jgi:glycosyltransferase involved in cell wall biosynthesis